MGEDPYKDLNYNKHTKGARARVAIFKIAFIINFLFFTLIKGNDSFRRNELKLEGTNFFIQMKKKKEKRVVVEGGYKETSISNQKLGAKKVGNT